MNHDNGALGQIRITNSGNYLEMGDSVRWTGDYIYLRPDRTIHYPGLSTLRHTQFYEFFQVRWGKYCRHPHKLKSDNEFAAYCPKGPYGGVISRDQLIGILAANIKEERTYEIFKMFIISLCSLGLFSYNTIDNGDYPPTAKRKWPGLTLFNIHSIFLRGLLGWVSVVPNFFLDAQDLLTVIYFNFKKGKIDKDPISLAMRLFIAREYYPTPVSWLTWKICDTNKLRESCHYYWTGWRDQYEMFELYRDKINELNGR